jgi:hypothetical protein
MKMEFDVNAQQLEDEINELLIRASESRSSFPNIDRVLKTTELELIKLSTDQRRITDFLKGRKGVSSILLMILFIVILFTIILIALIR